MAHVDPAARMRLISGKKFELKINELEADALEPIGDRYLVEELPVHEEVLFGSLLVLTKAEPSPENDPRNPNRDPQVERRGVMPAVVVDVGNGHLLGIPDPAFLDTSKAKGEGGEVFDDAADLETLANASRIKRAPADVPMFCKPGDVVLVDMNNRGRALKIAGRNLRVVNQMDVLVRSKRVRLKWNGDGWEREE